MNSKKIKKYFRSEKGISLYLTVLILTILLAISLGMSRILVGQIKMVGTMGNSVVAFYAADTGTERILYEDKLCRVDCPPLCPIDCGTEENPCPPGCDLENLGCEDRANCPCPCPSYCVDHPYNCSGLPDGYQIPQSGDWEELENGSKYKASFSKNLTIDVISIGTYQGIRRAIQATRE